MIRPRPKRPPGQVVHAQHDWRRLYEGAGRRPWWTLVATGPGEEGVQPGRGHLNGPAYVCERCGCVRMFAELCFVDEEGERSWRQVAFHGFDFDSLAPMNAPACEVWERPAVEPLDEAGEGREAA